MKITVTAILERAVIYVVRVHGRGGFQTKNDYWRIGAFLRSQPNTVYGGSFEPVELAHAEFGSFERCEAIRTWMADNFPEIATELVMLQESP